MSCLHRRIFENFSHLITIWCRTTNLARGIRKVVVELEHLIAISSFPSMFFILRIVTAVCKE